MVGGIEADDRGVGGEQVDLLDERTVGGGEGFVVAVYPRDVGVFGAHPEFALDLVTHARGEFLVVDRRCLAEFGEDVIGKAAVPQRRVGQVQRGVCHESFSLFDRSSLGGT